MKITGTLVNYYFHCKRQCWLFYNNINLEDNSEDVRLGKILHEFELEGKNSEISIDSIKVDKISSAYITEMKKSDADVEAAKAQLKYYMYVLGKKGVVKNGRLELLEKKTGRKNSFVIEYDEGLEAEMEEVCKNIEEFLKGGLPEAKMKKGCKKCAYYEYCFI